MTRGEDCAIVIDCDYREYRTEDFLGHERRVKRYIFNQCRLDESVSRVCAASIDDVSVLEISCDSFERLVVYHADIMSVLPDVFAMKIAYFSSECLHEIILHILMYKDIIWCDACLAAVQGLSPCDSLCSNSDVRSLVDDAWTLSYI